MINLVRSAADPLAFAGAHRHSWPVEITATTAENTISPKIFVYQAAAGRAQVAAFSCVASINQMLDLPEDGPTAGSPYFRRDVLEVLCRSAAEAEELWVKVCDDVNDLVANYTAAQALLNSATATI